MYLPMGPYCGLLPNATRQARLKAEAQRTLEAVACTRLFGKAAPGSPVKLRPPPAPSGRHDALRGAQEVYPLCGFRNALP
jgi:hypothetical protein